MPTFKSQRKLVEFTDHYRHFELIAEPSRGFTFPSDANGEPDKDQMHPEGWESYRDCLAHPELYRDCGVVPSRGSYWEPAVIVCTACGEDVELDRDDGSGVECMCGALYNLNGQRLQPRELWDEPMDED